MRQVVIKLGSAGLILASTVILAVGCGGGDDVNSATVTVTEPGTNVAVAAAPAGGGEAAPAPTTADAGKPSGAPTAGATKAEGFGTLKGRVTFAGDPPAPRTLVMGGDSGVKDAAVCAKSPIQSERLVVDPATKGVRYAIVYIPRPTAVSPEAASAAKAAAIDFDQKGCVFVPHALAVMKGATINVKSSDPVGHNVNLRLINTKFNSAVQPGSAAVAIQPKAAETRPGEVVCDIHPWMKSWWFVSNNPYFAVTDEEGNYEIKNVPAGTQKVVVWQEAVTPFVTPGSGEAVDVRANGETTKDFAIQPAQVKAE